MFLVSGLNKMNNYNNTALWMDAMGILGNLLPLVIALEVLGGAAIVIGWQTKIAAGFPFLIVRGSGTYSFDITGKG
jgi:putative oxidoreductase